MQNLSPKIKFLSVLIVFLLFSIGFSLYNPERKSTIVEEFQFAIKEPERIDRIVFGDIVLEKKGENQWTLNQNTPADLETVQELLEILAKIDIKRPVAASQESEIIKKIQEKGKEVQIFGSGELLQKFSIGGIAETSFALTPQNEPFVIYVPSMNLILHEVFNMAFDDWRDRTIVALSWLSIKSLGIEYPQTPEHSFSIRASERFYTVEGIEKLDSAMVYNYLQAYQNVRALMYLDHAPLRDSLLNQVPLCRISLHAIADTDSETISVWGDKNALFGYLANKKQLVQLQPRSFSRLFVRKKDFKKE